MQHVQRDVTRIGVISDTHGLLRPEAVDALRGAELILHAGDIGGPEILAALAELAPVTAVRGNNDRDAWTTRIPDRESLHIEGVGIHMLHDLKELDIEPREKGYRVVISGHSHKPKIEERDGVLYLNPGSAGPRRFTLPVSVARLDVRDGDVKARIIELAIPPKKKRTKS